jgi:hypothetical protein
MMDAQDIFRSMGLGRVACKALAKRVEPSDVKAVESGNMSKQELYAKAIEVDKGVVEPEPETVVEPDES